MNNSRLVILGLALFMFSYSSCTDSGDRCGSMVSKLRQCGLLSEGEFNCEEPSDDEERCEANCILQADCQQLESFICDDRPSTLIECWDECERESERFQCKTSGEDIDADEVCDRYEDCEDGSDEEGCPVFVCDDGEELPEYVRCDGYEECDDGSDEEGCPVFVCDDGERIPEDYRCDDDEDCEDGSDERNCPKRAEIICPEDRED